MPAITRPEPPTIWLNSQQASDYLRDKHGIIRAHRTLQNLRRTGKGPTYCRANINEVLYSPADLDAWAEQLTRHRFRHTAEEVLHRRGQAA